MVSAFILDIVILLFAAVITVPLSQALKLGAVPGFLIAGVVVGPFGLGLINKINEIASLAEIGVVFLLFVIGIELKPTRLWQMKRLVFGLGSAQVLLTGLVLGLVIYFFFDLPMHIAIFVGPTLALSSTAFVLQLLSEQKKLNTVYGRTSLAVLLLQDLAVVPLLALIPLLTMSELSIGENIGLALIQSMLVLGLVIMTGRYLLHPVLHRVALSGSSEIFTASAVLLVLGIAYVTEHIGLSMAMGAFLAGLLISDSSYRHQIMTEIQPFRGLLLGLFFISMGMSLNLNLLFEYPALSIGLVALLIIIKAVVLYPLVFLFSVKGKNVLAISLVLAQSGEFALIIFSIAFQSSILTELQFQQLILIVLLSMLATPLLAHTALWLVRDQEKDKTISPESPDEAPILLAGFGRVGHRIGEILTLANKPFVALDSDASVVEEERTKGFPVFYGDVRNRELLKAAGARHAKAIIVTLNDPAANEEVVSTLRSIYPDMQIYARGHSLSQCRDLRKLGATGAVSENVEASLELARMALISVGVNENKQESILENFRRKYREQIDGALKTKPTVNK